MVPRNPAWRQSRRGGFTVVELMVVVFVVALLAVMLLPYMGGARESALTSICKNNLDQLSVALHTHAAKNESKLPPPAMWMAAAVGCGGLPALVCPKGHYVAPGGGIAEVGGHVAQIDRPDSVVFNDLEDLKKIFIFKEQEAYRLPESVTVDISEPGFYKQVDSGGDTTPKTIPAGTVVDVHFIHYDSVGSQHTNSEGFVRFHEPIIGIIARDGSLDSTDDSIGHPDTVYETGRGARGFENNAEQVTLSDDRKTFTIHKFQITFPGEEVRILTDPGFLARNGVKRNIASYGYNARTDRHISDLEQVLLTDYDKARIELDDGDEVGQDELDAWLPGRHEGQANVLLVNGAVRLMDPVPELEAEADVWGPSLEEDD